MPEELKETGVVTLAVVKRNLRAYFLARGLCNKGTRGALQNHGACMSQTRKAVAALFAVTVSTAVGIGYIHLEQTEERKVCPSARRETSQSVPNFPPRRGTFHSRHAARRIKRRGDPPAILHRRERVTASAEAYPTSLSEP